MKRIERIACALLLACMTLAALAAAPASAPMLLVVGDSISAGYGLAQGEGWVALLQQRLARDGYRERVVNASISGDTTAGGRSRLPTLLREHRPSIVVIELGGNDALRGGNLGATRANLDAMVEAVQAARAKPLIVGITVPPNYGAAYADAFHALYGELARQYGTPLVGFFLDGVALDEKLMQADGIHPTAAAQPRLLDNLWPALQQVLKK
jgi:acyl-CoA thioesterase-1